MILAAFLALPALADQVSGAEKVAFGRVFGWWLPAPGAEARPAVIGLHGCNGLYARGELNARERGLAALLRARGFHVLLPDSFTRAACASSAPRRSPSARCVPPAAAPISRTRSTGSRRGRTWTARASW